MGLFAAAIMKLNISSVAPEWNEIIDLRRDARDKELEYWLSESLFTFNWWFLLVTTILFFAIWVYLLDKKRILEISAFGLLIGTIAFILDTIGSNMVLWSYPDSVFPIISPILEIHKFHMPIIYMIVYQYFQPWKGYLTALIISAAVFAFIFEPITVWLGIYVIYQWKYVYSFPIYILIGIILKWIFIKVIHIEKSNQSKAG
jgi:hypothetical protein